MKRAPPVPSSIRARISLRRAVIAARPTRRSRAPSVPSFLNDGIPDVEAQT